MIDTAALTPRQRALGLAAAYACIVATAAALGLTLPLIPLEIERQGYSAAFNGLNGVAGSIALLATAPFVPAIAARVGPIRLLAVCFLVAATCMAAFPLTGVPAWFPLRFILNCALQGLFVVSEVWINSFATERSRGRLIGLYGALMTAGFAAGPAIASLFPDRSMMPFFLGGAVILLGLGPVLAARTLAPHIEHTPASGLWAVFLLAPIPFLAAFAHSGAETAAGSFLPVFAVREGWSPSDAILLISAFGLGNVLLQVPIGWLSDWMDRRTVLAGCALLACLFGLLLPLAAHDPLLLTGVAFIWGGTIIGIYTVGLTLVGQIFTGARLAPASSAFALAYAGGSILGPGGAGLSMDLVGQAGLGWYVALICGVFGIIALVARRA
ncbi:hypothetical protein sos41_21910 [Alphaproteobacteria bacterium SO-S41]|nr:hypothetical protein sos41_21910 [Alphaproteobacteria bacterium SO-S41]